MHSQGGQPHKMKMTTGIILALLAAIVALWSRSTKGRHTSPQKRLTIKRKQKALSGGLMSSAILNMLTPHTSTA